MGDLMMVKEILNFISVSPGLAIAGQPTEQQLRALPGQGFEVVINLGLLDPKYCLADEAGLVRSLDLVYYHLPVNFQAPSLADLRSFFSLMDEALNRKVLIHCAVNKRASCFVSLYGQARLGWALEEAEALIRRIWVPDAIWSDLLLQARKSFSA